MMHNKSTINRNGWSLDVVWHVRHGRHRNLSPRRSHSSLSLCTESSTRDSPKTHGSFSSWSC